MVVDVDPVVESALVRKCAESGASMEELCAMLLSRVLCDEV